MIMENIDELVELDRLNMTPFIEQAGGTFDPELRREKLLLEMEKGSIVFSVQRSGKTIAYFEYRPEPNDVWNIMSIQIHPSYRNGFVLRDLLSEARERLQTHAPSAIRSSVHFTNQASLRLHRKLGFVKIEQKEDRILFVTDGKTLSERLARFKKRETDS
ncbi:MAG: GNAT family N-acetyltransferase [Phycisphaerae bacterium]|jgi:ribosomal protein S18 acetylase RimI-like enzyme|nr:GNAT family N-acetyltransferase [Phycisphaerae bacterium]